MYGDCNEYDNNEDDGEEERHENGDVGVDVDVEDDEDGEEEIHENGDVDHGDGLLHLDLSWCMVS